MRATQSVYNMVVYRSVRSTILSDNIQRVTRDVPLIFSLWLIYLYTQNARDVCPIVTTAAVSQYVSADKSFCPSPILTLPELQRDALCFLLPENSTRGETPSALFLQQVRYGLSTGRQACCVGNLITGGSKDYSSVNLYYTV